MIARREIFLVCALALVACRDEKKVSKAAAAGSAAASASASVQVASSSAAPQSSRSSAQTASVSPPRPTLPGDAGASTCRLAYGPALQSWRGPAAIHAGKGVVDVVFNEDGNPRALSVAIAPLDAKAAPPPAAPTTIATASYPPCAFGAAWVFCANKAGDVSRSLRVGGPAKVVGASRAGTRIDATALGGEHSLMAYLASRKTSEGWTSEAWAVVDDSPPVRISEDGSGATALDLAPRGTTVVAMMLDARSALTAVHARVLTFAAPGKIDIDKDAVVFVGGPPERHTASTIATPAGGGAGWVLLPIAKDIATFGMAAIHVDEPPKVDSPVVWSTYPNGIDPAPIAASQGRSPMYVARVRPVGAEPTAPRVLEIGRLEDGGAFTSFGFVSTTGAVTDVAIDVDAVGAVWLVYTDGAGTWMERRVCSW
jgi:hypothetical protein